MEIAAYKKQFDQYADAWIDEKLSQYPQLVVDEQVLSYIRHSAELIRGGGKRIRPYLAAFMYEACGGKEISEMNQVGLSLELFHTFALIHDDIIDRADKRRNVTTVHRIVRDTLMTNNRIGEIDHVANGQAMLVGDLLYLWVFDTFQQANFDDHLKKKAWKFLTSMINEVIVGEMLDVDITTRNEISDALLYQKTNLKTATYTFVRPMQIGATLAGAGEEVIAFCTAFGEALGMAFQIQDDLFDLTLSEAELHKPVMSDLKERQHTYFTQYIFTQGTDAQKQQLRTYFGSQTAAASDREAVTHLFVSSGALAYGTERMDQYFADALKALDRAPLAVRDVESLRALVGHIRTRSS